VLIVEDDAVFAQILLETARGKGFKGVIARNGEEALALARKFQFSAVTLDVKLPDIDGWSVLDRLKLNPDTRHIPVHIIAGDADRVRGLRHGAIACLNKPVSQPDLNAAFDDIRQFNQRNLKSLLVVEDNEIERQNILDLIGDGDIQVTAVDTGGAALKALKNNRYDCMILDLMLPDMSGFSVLEELKTRKDSHQVPVVVYTAKDLTQKEETQLRQMAETIVVKGVHSPERLLDETALFLHRVAADLPLPKRKMLDRLYTSDAVLKDKKVLLVDDDVRNLFSVTSILDSSLPTKRGDSKLLPRLAWALGSRGRFVESLPGKVFVMDQLCQDLQPFSD